MHDRANEPSTPPSDPSVVPSRIDFPLVGIGASAGGLKALVRFFENLPLGNDMAYVVILHLSPKHASSADQILQRATKMPVVQVDRPMAIERGRVYVIAPNMQLAMVDGILSIAHLERPHGSHVAIDIFFRTLAEVHRERAVAIVLSGTGADGAVGLKRIKELGGVTIAQTPEDAEHEGMPQAAIRTGIIDFILPVAEMPTKLIELWDNARSITLPPVGEDEVPIGHVTGVLDTDDAEDALQRIIRGLHSHTGHDFRHYKRATVLRRIERRMQVRETPTLPQYCSLLASDPREYALLLSDMLISVTNFFRDQDAYETMERDIVPELFKGKGAAEEVRVWVPACASGEEAYSWAMLLADHAATVANAPPVLVFATDINETAISQARTGLYPSSIITDVSPGRLRQYFNKDGDLYRIRKSLRDRILFATHNVLKDPPFSRLDMVSCRNLLIYLNRDVQIKVLEMFHFALKPGGYLFLGGSESAESVSDFFVPVDKKNRIYRARPASRGLSYQSQPSAHADRLAALAPRQTPRRQFSFAEVHQRALMQLMPPSVIVDRDSNIVHMSNDATQFMRVIAGEPTRNILALVLPELRHELRSGMFQSQQGNKRIECREVVQAGEDGNRVIQMSVAPFNDDDSHDEFLLIMFKSYSREAPPTPLFVVNQGDDMVLTQLEAELQRKKDQLQETIEHAEISNEELRASNEELQAINEELRSASEELETSKEELQSINEEFITVNYELKCKVEETSKANDDLNNLIASTDIATVFVDSELRIKRFTPRAADIFRMIATDIGRSLLDLSHRLDYSELAEDVSTSFVTLRPIEREVRSEDGRFYIVRLLPYRTTEDKIQGAVMTFFDITARREAEEQLRLGEARMRLVAESTKDYAIITTDAEGRATSWNAGAERVFGYSEDEMLGQPLEILFTPEDRANGAPEEEMRRAREEGRAEDERWHVRKDGSRVYCSGVATPLGTAAMYGYAKIARDQTDRVRTESERAQALSCEQQKASEAESAVAMKDEFLAIMSHELRHPLNIIHINVELLSRLPEVLNSATSQRAAAQIQTAVMSQAKIIDDLLDLSRASTGKLALAVAPMDVIPMVEEIADMVRGDRATSGLEIVVRTAPCPLVLVDAVRIEQVLMNLLSNAVKFTPGDGHIDIAVGAENGGVRIDIVDDGQGIDPAFLPQVFDMFGQASSVTTREKGGLGIGLALVREIVNLHEGWVEAASDGIGKGARFTVWLPAIDRPVQTPPSSRKAAGGDIAGKHILIVDDAQDILDVFQMLLKMEGAQVSVASSGEQGIAVLEQNDIDLLISDVSMPRMDGYEFLEQVRQMPRYQALPAIAVSGLVRESDLARARQAGFSAHMSKPMSMDRLLNIVEGLLRSTIPNTFQEQRQP